jgi:hypothetical protein
MIEITKEFADKVCKELGAVGIILIVTDSQIPCPDSRAGLKCEHSHEVASFISNMSNGGVVDIVEHVLEVMNNQHGKNN